MRGVVIFLWLAVLPYLLAGCGSPSRVVVLQHPMTRQTVECRVDPAGDIRRRTQIRNCVNAYGQAGYVVVGDSESELGTPVLEK
ncbi:MAG: hypothetical protein DME00_24655 [Candidatus Rokuibacteriota bacterium]|nr:MAG: hypothetical protein DME00_24655 [Candidatus Rokubacteria bacterium]